MPDRWAQEASGPAQGGRRARESLPRHSRLRRSAQSGCLLIASSARGGAGRRDRPAPDVGTTAPPSLHSWSPYVNPLGPVASSPGSRGPTSPRGRTRLRNSSSESAASPDGRWSCCRARYCPRDWNFPPPRYFSTIPMWPRTIHATGRVRILLSSADLSGDRFWGHFAGRQGAWRGVAWISAISGDPAPARRQFLVPSSSFLPAPWSSGP